MGTKSRTTVAFRTSNEFGYGCHCLVRQIMTSYMTNYRRKYAYTYRVEVLAPRRAEVCTRKAFALQTDELAAARGVRYLGDLGQ